MTAAERKRRSREKKRRDAWRKDLDEKLQKQLQIEQAAGTLLKPDKPLSMIQAPRGCSRLTTGGYGSAKVERLIGKSEEEERIGGRRVTPEGASPDTEPNDEGKFQKIRKEYDETFVEKQFKKFKSPREVRVLHAWWRDMTERISPKPTSAIMCLACRSRGYKCRLGGYDNRTGCVRATFLHFEKYHPEGFKSLMKRLEKLRCKHDHDAMVARVKPDGPDPVFCTCGKMIYDPNLKVIYSPSDETEKPQKEVS
jgi:hypothetical protein